MIFYFNRRIKLLSQQLSLNQSRSQQGNSSFPSMDNTDHITGNQEVPQESFSEYDDVLDYTSDISSTRSYDEPEFIASIPISNYKGLRDDEFKKQSVKAAVGNEAQPPEQKQTFDINMHPLLTKSRIKATITNKITNDEEQIHIDEIPDYSELRAEIESQDVHEYTDLSEERVELAPLAENKGEVSTNDYQHLRRSRMEESEYSAVSRSDW